MTAILLVGLGGGLGAVVRWLASRGDTEIPWGLIAVNVAASAAAGALSDIDPDMNWLVNVGFLGALSTWSTLAVWTVREDDRRVAVSVLLGSTAACIAAALLTLQLT